MLREFIKYYKPYKRVFFLDLFFASIISVVNLAFPQVLRYLTRILYAKNIETAVKTILTVGLILFLGYCIQTYAKYYVSSKGHIMGALMERDMRKKLFSHYQNLSFSYYDKHNTGQMMAKLVSDLFDISEMAHHAPENLFIAFISLIGAFIFLIRINVSLTLVLIVLSTSMFVFSLFQSRKMKRTFADNREKIGNINETLQDSLSGIRVVQSFANEDVERGKFKEGNENFLSSKKANYETMGVYMAGNSFFQGMMFVTVIIYGGYLLLKGKISAQDLAMFALYINIYIMPVKMLVELTEMIQKGFSGFKRFSDIMKVSPEIQDKEDAVDIVNPSGDIILDDVSFHYDPEELVLNNINMTIKAGEKVALVGPSGGGKSTLCSLIPRFYELNEGCIRIGGQNIQDIKLNSLRNAIGIVQQEVYLFGGSIRDNIAYGKMDASDEEIIEAAKKANIHDFIISLPDGYETFAGQQGVRLSGGQKQRISIARLFLKNPPILILDEATSALDNESERYIQSSLEELAKNKTTISIAHRLSTIKNSDKIYVIAENQIKEAGSHEKLIEEDGIYSKYYKMQER